MRNFLLFIRRFSNLLLFLIVEIACIILIARTNTIQGNDIMSSANLLIGSVYQKQDDVAYYFALRRMNDSLLNENIRLRSRIATYNSVDTLNDFDFKQAIVAEDDTASKIIKYANYTYRTARVINNSVTAANNYITINRGSSSGIKKDMAVVSGNGIVGRVVNVSSKFATVLSVLSVKQQVSAKLKDGTFGYVTWKGRYPDRLTMKDVSQQIKVAVGDSVFTTSYSFFPANVLIGVVAKKEMQESNNLQLLHLKTATSFRNLQYVYIIENENLEERQDLEAATN